MLNDHYFAGELSGRDVEAVGAIRRAVEQMAAARRLDVAAQYHPPRLAG